MSSPQVPAGTLPDVLAQGWLDPGQLTAAAENLRLLAGQLNRATLLTAIPGPNDETGRSRQIALVEGTANQQPVAGNSRQAESRQLLDDLQASNSMAQSAIPLDRRQQCRARNVPAQQELRSDMEYQQRVESERLAQLIENVLAYSRLEGRRVVTHSEDVTIGQLVDRFTGRLQRRTDQANMILDVAIDDALGHETVRTDASAIEQIVANLVDNACKYSSTSTDRRIHVAMDADTRWLRVRVTDHGPGIAADVARRLFRPFCRSAQEAANSAPGVGLGLALSRRLARRLGGNLTLLPSHTAGACFELKLPRFDPNPSGAGGAGDDVQ